MNKYLRLNFYEMFSETIDLLFLCLSRFNLDVMADKNVKIGFISKYLAKIFKTVH